MPAKTCQICGEDCSDRPRVRDGQGRYACKECLERKQRSRGTGRESGPPPATDDAALLAQLVADAPPPQAVPCPQCGGRIDTGNVICTNCGYNTSTGEAAKTRVLKAEKQPRQKAKQSADVSGVAVWQKRLLACILLYILGIFAVGAMSVVFARDLVNPDTGQIDQSLAWQGKFLVARIGLFAIFAGGLVCAVGIMRSMRLHIAAIIPLAFVLLIPCVGLVTLLVINGLATSQLKKAGYRVGLLGVK